MLIFFGRICFYIVENLSQLRLHRAQMLLLL